MPKAVLKLSFRHEIDFHSATPFEKDVFSDSYQEFLLQSQAYNRESAFRTLDEMISHNPKANSLHYKVGFGIGLYISGLNHSIPGIRKIVPGRIRPTFQSHDFEIVHSDITDRAQHRIAITYYTGTLTLLDNFGEHLLLTTRDLNDLPAGHPIETFMLKPVNDISIAEYTIIGSACPHYT